MLTKPSVTWLAVLASLVLAGCTEPTTPGSNTTSDTRNGELAVSPPAGDFVPESNNPYFPLVPGTTFHYESQTDEGLETQAFTVTTNTKIIQGITPA
jgi:hypothetical protein